MEDSPSRPEPRLATVTTPRDLDTAASPRRREEATAAGATARSDAILNRVCVSAASARAVLGLIEESLLTMFPKTTNSQKASSTWCK